MTKRLFDTFLKRQKWRYIKGSQCVSIVRTSRLSFLIDDLFCFLNLLYFSYFFMFSFIMWWYSCFYLKRNLLLIQTDCVFIFRLLFVLKNEHNCLFNVLIDLSAIDLFFYKKRFVVVYLLYSILFNIRCIIKILLESGEHLVSIRYLFENSIWCEREVFDMFGITFIKHGDLRRLLTDYGFVGFPLLKHFPLVGYNIFFFDEHWLQIKMGSIVGILPFRIVESTNPWWYFYSFMKKR